MSSRQLLDNFPWGILVVTLLLLGFGMVNLYSATHASNLGFFIRQLVWLFISLGFAGLVTAIDYRIYERTAYGWYGLTILLLALTHAMPAIKGSHRWLELGVMRLQPSIVMWFVIFLALGRWFHDSIAPKKGYRLRDLWQPAAMTAVAVGLILAQPDLGTSLLVLFIAGVLFLFAKIQTKTLLILLLLGLIAAPLTWQYGLKDYQKKRIETLLSPDEDVQGAGYHRRQSIIAIGSGRLTGKGYLEGTQTQLRFLPEQHTDFIFSVWAEEQGFLGSIFLLGLYFYLFVAGLVVASRAREKFGALICVGAVALLFFQTFVNIGMVLGLLPVVGVPLPFLSYGGTAMVINLACVAVLLNVGMRRYMF